MEVIVQSGFKDKLGVERFCQSINFVDIRRGQTVLVEV